MTYDQPAIAGPPQSGTVEKPQAAWRHELSSRPHMRRHWASKRAM